MIVSIMQPAYLPWLGYFNRLLVSDLHLVLDHVQIDKNSKTNFANRNKIRTHQGWTWLTVPILRKGQTSNLKLNSIQIADDPAWARKAWANIEYNYHRAEYFSQYAPLLEAVFEVRWTRLLDLNDRLTSVLRKAFGIDVETRSSSKLGVEGTKDDLILNLCKAVGATTYVSGPFGRDYLVRSKFDEAGIEVRFHDYAHPHYKQVYSGFVPYMSAVDLLLNCGPSSRDVLMMHKDLKTK